ncbi:hypothetical protein BS50DRAFT_575653 [Corynespora cassiicola Philippines]|uniref:Complex I intermediate-associated protein-like protein 84 n=1 Tax=Corynespora cassiicola Philippines TaxID=1448308 RepID=A0A2T2NG21_CORCC|nr:hypothetical protein BS50DRAFT_575653 [Corynespora cassiicola Philippines]
MPSHLTRVVFRSIVANKPMLYRGCLYRSARPRLVSQYAVRALPPLQRRSFFNFLKPQRKIKDAELPPGLEALTDLAYMQRVAARPPPPPDVAKAFNAFFQPRHVRCEDFHVTVAHNGLNYLRKNPPEDRAAWLTVDDLRQAFDRLLEARPESAGEAHLNFGRALHDAITKLHDEQKLESAKPDSTGRDNNQDLSRLVQLLCAYGATIEAREIAVKSYVPHPAPNWLLKKRRQVALVWLQVLRGFAREENVQELLATTSKMRELAVPFTPSMQQLMVTFFIQQNDLDQAKHWYLQPVMTTRTLEKCEPTGATHVALLKAQALSGDLTFGHQVVASLLKGMPSKEAWDAIFIWSVAIGKGPDEIDRMMNVMVRRNDEERQKSPATEILRPDIDTINALVEQAMTRQDSYSAERFVFLGEKRGILPNEKTFTLQMQYRLSIKDVDGARAAYFGLQGNMTDDGESIKAVNHLIQVLCEMRHHHFDDIMAIVDDLLERKARLTPETLASLCALHLRRGENHDAMEILQLHAHHFSPAQRVIISDKLARFILDGQTSTADAWDAYQILRHSFPETSRDMRIRIMNEFFARKRSDMACHVFFHMRNHPNDDVSANREVYIAAFTGFARNADTESLELAHNQLKLDLHVEMDTKMRNSLMLAYAAVGKSRRALEFWAEIGSSKEGPTYNSIAIAFRACERMPFGDEHAKKIWRRLREMDVDIDKEIYTAYLSAVARNHLHEEALALVESAEDEYGFTPDLFILGNWFNTTAHIDRQRKVEAWIRERYPAVWSELEALGHEVTMDGFGYRQFNINRDLDP